MRHRLVLTAALLLVLSGGLGAEEERVRHLPFLDLPTLEGERLPTWSLRGSKVLLVEFASW